MGAIAGADAEGSAPHMTRSDASWVFVTCHMEGRGEYLPALCKQKVQNVLLPPILPPRPYKLQLDDIRG